MRRADGIDAWGFPALRVVASVPVPPVFGAGKRKSALILEGLRRLSGCAAGGKLTLRAIAGECGCDKESIRRIEGQAKRKVRRRLERIPEAREVMRGMGDMDTGRMFEAVFSRGAS